MRNKLLSWLAPVSLLTVVLCGIAVAQHPGPVRLSGTIDDYNPANLGSYEMHGTWSLTLDRDFDRADFSLAMDMEHSDLAMLSGTTTRNAHTHHITVVGGTVTPLSNGFRVTGAAVATGNGAFPAPFGPNSTLQIDVTGANQVEFSNIQLTFVKNADGSNSDAASHFGSQAINGVVRKAKVPGHGED